MADGWLAAQASLFFREQTESSWVFLPSLENVALSFPTAFGEIKAMRATRIFSEESGEQQRSHRGSLCMVAISQRQETVG